MPNNEINEAKNKPCRSQRPKAPQVRPKDQRPKTKSSLLPPKDPKTKIKTKSHLEASREKKFGY